jgi:hypothetical protein
MPRHRSWVLEDFVTAVPTSPTWTAEEASLVSSNTAKAWRQWAEDAVDLPPRTRPVPVDRDFDVGADLFVDTVIVAGEGHDRPQRFDVFDDVGLGLAQAEGLGFALCAAQAGDQGAFAGAEFGRGIPRAHLPCALQCVPALPEFDARIRLFRTSQRYRHRSSLCVECKRPRRGRRCGLNTPATARIDAAVLIDREPY